MLKFQVFQDGRAPEHWPVRNAYLIGSDTNPMRAEVTYADGLICCDKREAGTAALALQYPVGDIGELTLQTCLLPERDQPYLLSLELARHRLMVLYNKLEDWAMFDLGPDHVVLKRTDQARQLFLESMSIQPDDPVKADQLAYECLTIAMDGTEELALAHSALFLNKRKSAGAIPKYPIGCGVYFDTAHERVRTPLVNNFDFVHLPTPWKTLAPEEAEYHWDVMDNWANWAAKHKLPVIGGPIVSFDPGNLPDWLYIWEHDYDTVRDLIYEHVERVVRRYEETIQSWIVAGGLHVNSNFSFNFEQLMDLTRMVCMLVKKVQPEGRTYLELRQPFGEYFSRNQRSIPPLMYADLVVQSGIGFDGYVLRLPMGQALPGQYTRDLMQISHLLDQFQILGKPVYVVFAAPSEPVTEAMIAAPTRNEPIDADSGYWRRPWSMTVQSHWLEAVFQIAISKPFVEAVSWQELVDHPKIELPLGGLVTEELEPKSAFKRLVSFRKSLHSKGQEAAAASSATDNAGA